MKVSEILRKTADFKEDNDYEGFKNMMDNLDFTEVCQLMLFSKELHSFCKKKIKQ